MQRHHDLCLWVTRVALGCWSAYIVLCHNAEASLRCGTRHSQQMRGTMGGTSTHFHAHLPQRKPCQETKTTGAATSSGCHCLLANPPSPAPLVQSPSSTLRDGPATVRSQVGCGFPYAQHSSHNPGACSPLKALQQVVLEILF